ncbi:MAG: IS200/IS605 family transposase [Verrucomicrobiales bacterium]
MPQSLCQSYLHLVFSTKDRAAFFADPELRKRCFAYLAGACRNMGSPAMEVGGFTDHIHILCRQSKTISVAELVRELKRQSSKWVKEQSPDLRGFFWQKGYGAFSLSPNHVRAATDYIRHQEAHHRKESFQDEFRRICRKYGAEIDERYAWD